MIMEKTKPYYETWHQELNIAKFAEYEAKSVSQKICAVIMAKDFGSRRGATMAHSPFL